MFFKFVCCLSLDPLPLFLTSFVQLPPRSLEWQLRVHAKQIKVPEFVLLAREKLDYAILDLGVKSIETSSLDTPIFLLNRF